MVSSLLELRSRSSLPVNATGTAVKGTFNSVANALQ
jgi:hypothetical protein